MDPLIEEVVREEKAKGVVPFLGSGVSLFEPTGLPSWWSFIKVSRVLHHGVFRWCFRHCNNKCQSRNPPLSIKCSRARYDILVLVLLAASARFTADVLL